MTHPVIKKCARAIAETIYKGDSMGDDECAMWVPQAIAVLSALREPDDSMKVSGGIALEEAMFNGEPDGTVFDAAGLSFTAAIDSILPKEDQS